MRAWTFVCDALDASNNPVTLRFSDNKYIDAAKNNYKKRLVQPAIITVSPTDGGVLNIFSSASVGEIELINNDGALNYLEDYAFDGRNATIALMDNTTVLKTATYTAAKIAERNGRKFITLRTLHDTLNTEHPFDKYAGDNVLPNGVEGVATDIKGNNKYKVFGDSHNISPTLVNSALLIYQACSRATTLIGGARDQGVGLTRVTPDYADITAMQATAPAAGYYRCYRGLMRLGATPVGEVTCDCYEPSKTGAGHVLQAIIAERGGSVDAASIALLNTVGAMGIYVNAGTTWSMVETIARSTGSYIYIENNICYAKLLDLSVTPTWIVKPHQLLRVERKATGIGENGLPIAMIEMKADFLETKQNLLDGTAVPMADIARYKEQSRKVTASSSATLDRHPLAGTLKIDSQLRSLTAAQAVCDRLLAIVSVRRDVISIDLQFANTSEYVGVPDFNIGDGLQLITKQLGYGAGKKFVVIGYTADIKKNKITLELIG